MVLESILQKVSEQQKLRLMDLDEGLIREKDLHLKSIGSHALIISGVRRCGKSTLLLQLLKKKKDTFYLNFETPLLYGFSLTDFERLDKVIKESKSKWLFFDEIQIVEEWERYIRQKLDEGYKIVITGSNASLLSRELGSKLTGRHITQELFPFSYNEYLQYKKLKKGHESLMEFMNFGGFPEYIKSRDEEQLYQLFHDLVIRDIVVRHHIKEIKNLQLLTVFLISNIGNRITATKLKQSFSISATSTISAWFSFLEDAYLISFVPMYKSSLRAQAINPRKIYAIDTGLVNTVSSNLQKDLGHKLENMVYLHLRRKYQQIYYFDENGECDFIAFKKNKIAEIVQVCFDLNPDNLKREINGLKKAMKAFDQKTAVIITSDQKDSFGEDGYQINVIPAYEYLLM